MTVFWDVAPCSLVEVYRCYRGAYCLYRQGKLLPDYAAQHLRRESSSSIPMHCHFCFEIIQVWLRKVKYFPSIPVSKKLNWDYKANRFHSQASVTYRMALWNISVSFKFAVCQLTPTYSLQDLTSLSGAAVYLTLPSISADVLNFAHKITEGATSMYTTFWARVPHISLYYYCWDLTLDIIASGHLYYWYDVSKYRWLNSSASG
jgi:hypothetical protein